MIQYGKELLRISPKDTRKIEYSTSGGRTCNIRYQGQLGVGAFKSISDMGKELVAQTENGIYYSTNKGVTWNRRSR